MANRAYLYASESEDDNNWELPDNDEIFDSRHGIPIAWWFLFEPQDMMLIDVRYEKSSWKEIRFRTGRIAALERFIQRRPCLQSIIGDALDARFLDFFVAVVSTWTGQHLLMNPEEIFQGDVEVERDEVQHALCAISEERYSPTQLLQRLPAFSSTQMRDSAAVSILGSTYGSIGHKLFEQILQ